MPYSNDKDELINLINILSFLVGLTNMQENRLQSAQNDVQAANQIRVKAVPILTQKLINNEENGGDGLI